MALVFDDRQSLGKGLAQHIRELWEKHDGVFNIALSGGSLLPLFIEQVVPLLNGIDFSQWSVWWVDERLVPIDDAESNFGQATRLISAHNSPLREATMHHLTGTEEAPLAMHLALLGMGEDGHFASLFPGTASLKAAIQSTDAYIEVHDSPKPPLHRITLTPCAIRSLCMQCWFVITGRGKAEAVCRNLVGHNGLVDELGFRPQHWFLDCHAAFLLPQ